MFLKISLFEDKQNCNLFWIPPSFLKCSVWRKEWRKEACGYREHTRCLDLSDRLPITISAPNKVDDARLKVTFERYATQNLPLLALIFSNEHITHLHTLYKRNLLYWKCERLSLLQSLLTVFISSLGRLYAYVIKHYRTQSDRNAHFNILTTEPTLFSAETEP